MKGARWMTPSEVAATLKSVSLSTVAPRENERDAWLEPAVPGLLSSHSPDALRKLAEAQLSVAFNRWPTPRVADLQEHRWGQGIMEQLATVFERELGYPINGDLAKLLILKGLPEEFNETGHTGNVIEGAKVKNVAWRLGQVAAVSKDPKQIIENLIASQWGSLLLRNPAEKSEAIRQGARSVWAQFLAEGLIHGTERHFAVAFSSDEELELATLLRAAELAVRAGFDPLLLLLKELDRAYRPLVEAGFPAHVRAKPVPPLRRYELLYDRLRALRAADRREWTPLGEEKPERGARYMSPKALDLAPTLEEAAQFWSHFEAVMRQNLKSGRFIVPIVEILNWRNQEALNPPLSAEPLVPSSA